MLRAALLGVAAFLVVLLVRLPARWITPLLPAAAQCQGASGTVWNGACEGLSLSDGKSQPLVLQQLRWDIHAAALFRGRLAADVATVSDWGQARADLSLGTGSHLIINSLAAEGTLDRRLLSVLPSGWTGRFQARDVSIEMQQRRLLSLRGVGSVQGLQDGNGEQYGDFQLQMAPEGGIPGAGELRDTGGPIELSARVLINPDLTWTLDGRVGTRAGQLPQLQKQLEVLGAPDAAGRRPLSASGYF
jgi:Type II secretion system (T2SS), protein N